MTDNIDEITKVGSPLPKVELPVEYALGWRDSEYSTNFTTNNPAYWDEFETNSSSIQKSSGNTSQITLSGGKTYKLTGHIALREQSNTQVYRRFRWYNVTKGEDVGSKGGFYSGYSSYSGAGGGPAIAYLALQEDAIFELRCAESSGDADYLTYGTSFEIEHFQNLKI